jgi:hypothetical protein
MSPFLFSIISEPSEARAHLYSADAIDQAPAQDWLRSRTGQVNRRTGTGHNRSRQNRTFWVPAKDRRLLYRGRKFAKNCVYGDRLVGDDPMSGVSLYGTLSTATSNLP